MKLELKKNIEYKLLLLKTQRKSHPRTQIYCR